MAACCHHPAKGRQISFSLPALAILRAMEARESASANDQAETGAPTVSPEQRIWDRWRERIRRLPSGLVLGVSISLILGLAAFVSFLPLMLGVNSQDLESLGYPGVFIANFLGTATLFFPVPGLTAAGQALIVALSDDLNPNLVALLGGSGMALAELTAYGAGRGLREVSAEREMPLRGIVGRWLRYAAGVIDRLMVNYGVPTLFILSALPNPLFEFAGVTAGAVRMNLWKFLAPVVVGKMLRAFLLAYLGQRFLDLIT